MNIIFMGTPDFAVPCLKALVDSGENVTAVFTQPDKPKGRGYKMIPTPVKAAALEYGLDVYQPQSLRKGEEAEEALEIIRKLAPELIVVVAYGQILPESLINIPVHGCINVHASLLPAYRGAAPIQWCILNGEKVSGVTTMMIDTGLDTGDMLLKAEVPISENETSSELHDALSESGARLLTDTIKCIKDGNLVRTPQDGSLATYSPMITKDMSMLDFTQPAQKLHNIIRGITGFAFIGGKRLKVFRSELTGKKSSGEPGLIADTSDFSVVCGDGQMIRFTEVQPEGGKRLKIGDYLRGNRIADGTVLTSSAQ